jgi:hypothetical protein
MPRYRFQQSTMSVKHGTHPTGEQIHIGRINLARISNTMTDQPGDPLLDDPLRCVPSDPHLFLESDRYHISPILVLEVISHGVDHRP